MSAPKGKRKGWSVALGQKVEHFPVFSSSVKSIPTGVSDTACGDMDC